MANTGINVPLLEFLLQNVARGDNDVLTKVYQIASEFGKLPDVLEVCTHGTRGLLLPVAVEKNDLPFIKMLIDKRKFS